MKSIELGMYSYKEKPYKALRLVKLKHPATREWVDAVEYVTADDRSQDTFVRELEEFLDRFEKLK